MGDRLSGQGLREVRVEELLRGFADQLLKARSAAGVFRALAQATAAVGLELVCVAATSSRIRKGDRALLYGHKTAAQRGVLDRLHPIGTHPLFSETLAEGGVMLGSEICKRRGLSRAAWNGLLPPELAGLETLSLIVRGDERGGTGGDWFVLMSMHGDSSGLAFSLILVAAHLARDRYDALTQQKSGRVRTLRVTETLQLILYGKLHIDALGVAAPTGLRGRRRGSSGRLH